MNIGLIIGKKNSVGTPGKNIRTILGRPSAEYAFIAANNVELDRIYVSTDCPIIAQIGQKYNATHIIRPPELALPDTLTEDALLHAYSIIKSDVKEEIKTISLLFANNPAIDVHLLKEAIAIVNQNEQYDSCFSVAKYDMFSPARARKLNEEEIIETYLDAEQLKNISSIRDSQGSIYYCDLSIQVMKPSCFENMNEGKLPFKWQGRNSKAVVTDFGFDIDAEWQVPVIEYWLRKHGFTEETIPW